MSSQPLHTWLRTAPVRAEGHRAKDSGQLLQSRVKTKHGEVAFSCYAANKWNKLFLVFNNFNFHPSIFYTRLSRGGAGAYPSGHRARGRVHLGQVASPSQGHTNNNARSHSLLRTILESPINLTCMFSGQWEEVGVPRETPRIHGENMQTPHRKAPGGDRTWNPLAVRRQC